MATAVPTNADRSVHNTARAARTIAVYIHGSTEPLLYAQPALACAPACATRARTVSRNCRDTESEVRAAAAHSRRRRHRQPRASDAHPCTALCARRRGVAYRLNLEQVSLCHSSCTTPIHTVRQQPARLMTRHGQQVCHHCCQVAAQECAARRTARHSLCVRPNHRRTHNPCASLRIGVRNYCTGSRATAAIPNRNKQLNRNKHCVNMAAHSTSQ